MTHHQKFYISAKMSILILLLQLKWIFTNLLMRVLRLNGYYSLISLPLYIRRHVNLWKSYLNCNHMLVKFKTSKQKNLVMYTEIKWDVCVSAFHGMRLQNTRILTLTLLKMIHNIFSLIICKREMITKFQLTVSIQSIFLLPRVII